MMILAALMALLAVLAAAQPAIFETGQLGQGIAGDVEIPTLGTSDGRTIYCVYSSNVNTIWIQSTTDAGETWTAPVEVMGLPGPNYITDANILVDGQRITVFATHAMDEPGQRGKIARSKIRVALSEDGGRTWSGQEPIPVPHRYVCGCMNTPVWLDGDTVVMGYSWDLHAEAGKPVGDEGAMTIRSGVLISHDRGRTWTPGADAGPDIPTMGLDEPALVRLRSGDLFAVLRTNQARPYETVSHDGGLTWEPVRPSRLRGYNTPAALLRLADGGILRAWDNSSAHRFPLVVAVSEDECQTWSAPATVATPGPGDKDFQTACYPSLAQATDGTILIAWWQRAAGRNSVKFARFNRAWVDEAARAPRPVKIVAFGDSVTRGVRDGLTEAQTFRQLLREGLRVKGIDVEVVDAGVPGHNTVHALQRLESDVLDERPALVIVMFGVNDAAMVDGGPVARTAPRVPLAEYVGNLRRIVQTVRETGAQVILCTPTPMSRKYPYSHMGAYAEHEDMNYLVRDYALSVRDVGEELGVQVVDVFRLFEDRPDGLELILDGNHPFVEGHRMIAEALLEPVAKLLTRP